MEQDLILVDGGVMEAGGQILRTAAALATVTKKPCRVFNIRKGRPKPGLAPQHLLGIRALARLCGGRLEGDELASQEIKFWPGSIDRYRISINIPTAGSITLILQALILPALFALEPIRIIFNGGATDTFFSPTLDYFRYVFLEILAKMAGQKVAEVEVERRGFYPAGGAKVRVKILPSQFAPHQNEFGAGLKAFRLLEREPLKKILAISGASEFLKNKKVAERQMAGIREILGKLKLPLEERVEYYQTQCPGSQVCLIAEFENTVLGSGNLGKLGKRAEDVGKEAALKLLQEQKTEACLDQHLADQILPYLALSDAKSSVTVSKITNHCRTNIWVIEKFLDGKFEIKDNLISWNPK